MSLNNLLSILAALIAFGVFVPYGVDILKGRARPARSTRIMFAALMMIALLQQHSLGSGWALAVTIGEAVGSLAILVLALFRGIGGLKKIDITCYLLLLIDLVVWLTTQNAFLALHLTVLADLIAFIPTLAKTWRYPESETPIFFIGGLIAPILSILAAGDFRYSIMLFPLWLVLANTVEVGLIYRKRLSQVL